MKIQNPTICILVILCACKDAKVDNFKKDTLIATRKASKDSLLNKLNGNIHFIGNSLLNNKASLLKIILEKYQPDTCETVVYKDSSLKQGFEGIKNIGDINRNNLKDSVFVLPPFNYCDDGYSYYFFDTTLPRLYTDSYCCRPDNLFPIGDIDEDGATEICIFYSSCTSRFKSLIAYSLKKINGNKLDTVRLMLAL